MNRYSNTAPASSRFSAAWPMVTLFLAFLHPAIQAESGTLRPQRELLPVLASTFEIPTEAKDNHGNPVLGLTGGAAPSEETGAYKIVRREDTRFRWPEWPDEIRQKQTGMHFILIPAGKFIMGSPEKEKDRQADEGPQHEVRINRPFYMGKYEVTQAEWEKVMGTKPWTGYPFVMPNPAHAANYITWFDAQKFVEKLNSNPRLHRRVRFALPTEAQWEYACRSGTTTRFYYGDDIDYLKIDYYAWYDGNTDEKANSFPQPVGKKRPNLWGLYDMHGNVWEWCQDIYGPYSEKPAADPRGALQGDLRVLRGGSWPYPARYCRSATRFRIHPAMRWSDDGLRVIVQIK